MPSSSSSSYSSDSESSEERRRREKKERKRKREKKEKKERKRREKKEKKRKHEKSDKKSSKKSRKERDVLRETASGATWGKYGIIKEGDMYDKQEEFLAWLAEVKGVQQEACGQREMKEHFSTFCEDYNTATLPNEKYYNLQKWYVKEQQRKAMAEQPPPADDDDGGGGRFERTSFDDEADRKRELMRQRAARSEATTKVMAQAMRGGEGLVQDMREQQAAQQKMRAAYQTGHTDTAREMATKLDPKYVSPEEMKKILGGPAPINSKKPGGMGSGH